MSNGIKFLTIYKGKSSITYLASDFEKFGDNAIPYSIRQNPSENAPFHKFELKDTEAIELSIEPQISETTSGWNIDALRKLLSQTTNKKG